MEEDVFGNESLFEGFEDPRVPQRAFLHNVNDGNVTADDGPACDERTTDNAVYVLSSSTSVSESENGTQPDSVSLTVSEKNLPLHLCSSMSPSESLDCDTSSSACAAHSDNFQVAKPSLPTLQTCNTSCTCGTSPEAFEIADGKTTNLLCKFCVLSGTTKQQEELKDIKMYSKEMHPQSTESARDSCLSIEKHEHMHRNIQSTDNERNVRNGFQDCESSTLPRASNVSKKHTWNKPCQDNENPNSSSSENDVLKRQIKLFSAELEKVKRENILLYVDSSKYL